jgi:hypothetical protein
MLNTLQEKLLSSRLGQIGLLVFSAYTFIWGIIEPLDLQWIDKNRALWRIILLVFSGIITIILSIRLSNPINEEFNADGPNRTLQGSYSSRRNPQITVAQDGQLGNVVNINGNNNQDELDWIIRSSAQKSNTFEIIYTNTKDFYFYIRVGLVSQNGQTSIERWIRFDSRLTTPNPYVNGTPELGVPYISRNFKGFEKTVIKIPDAVKQSYGQGGWTYSKVLLFRIRCDTATLKSIIFKK